LQKNSLRATSKKMKTISSRVKKKKGKWKMWNKYGLTRPTVSVSNMYHIRLEIDE
jgi:hypothetical protein